MDSLYEYPETALAKTRAAKPWMSDPKHFTKVKVSPSASIKMLMHGQQGVDKGTKTSGKPVEVMGLLLGRPDTEDPHSLLVSDALPLPAEGFETRVVVEDPAVTSYMISLMETLETTRKEHFCGWYHTHPFDLDGTSHCYLSATDVSTQLLWQVSEDPHGQPWVAIVLDPLLSLEKERPEVKAFRVYPPTYAPPAHETPDGQIVKSEAKCVQQWGACWNRYYTLSVEHFMSDLSRDTLSQLHNQLLWHQALSAPAGPETEEEISRDVAHMETATAELSSLSVSGTRSLRRTPHTQPSPHTAEGEQESTTGTHNGAAGLTAWQEQHACTACSLWAKTMLFCRQSQREKTQRESGGVTQSSANASAMDI